jgi:D-alanyl-lipoteichoic acid acyltransferase DltB (MBOAT superfamily)
VAIADRLAVYVNAVYGQPELYPASSLVLATFIFAFQIYTDFSGYTDTAIGCARVLGFDLMTNFKRPYFAASISDFWKKWHISLTTWLRDYIYIPLGGNRHGLARQCINIMIVFAISGLWHGAAWHFVVWGLLHGLYQTAERVACYVQKQVKLPLPPPPPHAVPAVRGCRLAKTIITFSLVCLTWVFFRAQSINDAFLIFRKLATLGAEISHYIAGLPQMGVVGTVRQMFQLGKDVLHPVTGFGITTACISCIFIFAMLCAEFIARKSIGTVYIMRLPIVLRWILYYALIISIIFSWNIEAPQFIYFTF